MTSSVFAIGLLGLAIAGWSAVARAQEPDFITHITREDMVLLMSDAPPEQLREFAAREETRKGVLKQVKELIAEAVEARNRGMASSPEAKEQLAFMRSMAVAQAYDPQPPTSNSTDSSTAIKTEEIDGFLKLPGLDEKFANFVKAAQAGKILPAGDIPDAQRTKLKQDWAKILLTEKKAAAEGFDKQRRTQLKITLQQAQLLAQKYITEVLLPQVTASDAEVANYLGRHPELDPAPARVKIEALLRRARAGESFSALARANTDDPGSKENGGFYDWFGPGKMVREFEDAAFKLRLGQISGIVETQYGYHIIKLVGRRKFWDRETGKSEVQIRVRHILISTMAPPDPDNPMAPQLPVKDKAKAEVEKAKREKLVDDLFIRTGVTVPEDWL